MRNIYILILLSIQIQLLAQSGPAGVGTSSTNILWLRSSDIGQSNNSNISTWADQSGNSNDITQPTSSYQPLYITNVLNSYPAVRFSTDDRLRKTSFSDFPTSAISVFMVNSNQDTDDGSFSYASSSNNNEFLVYNSNNIAIYRGNTNSTSSISSNDNNFHIINANWKGSNGAVSLWKDGNNSYTSTLASGTSITSGGCLAIAGEQDAIDGSYDPSQFFDGDFTEVIVYNVALNDAEKIIVANYLAAKYNLTISNDYYAYQSTHSYDVAGIGRKDASNTHTAAMSAGILQIENPSSMTTDGEYLLFGHDNGSISSWTTTEAPSVGNIERIAREWRLDETGSVGTIDFKISTSDLPALNSGYTKYGVMVDSDGDFSSGASVYELSASGSDYTVSGISINDGDYVSIAAINPTVEFTNTTATDQESNNASAEVHLNYIAASTVSVDYTTADGTATAGSDYTATSSTLNITAGTSSNTISITVNDDATMESDEDFSISISNPSTGINLGANTSCTYTIIDNDNSRKMSFDSTTSNGSESTTSVSIGLSINIADGSSATTADYSVTGGTATGGGTDYTLSSGTVTFPAGTTTANISFSVNDDALDEDNETIIISLSNPTNCNLASPTTHTYTINDDDAAPTIQFTSTSSSGLESIASKSISISLSAASGKDISVSLSTSGTATKGTDYTISANSATITAGNTSTSISLSITNDTYVESNETAIVTMSSPVNASIGSNNSHTYTITNDDNYGYDGPGGVGESSNIKLWVKAEDIPGNIDGDRISSWQDRSGNSNNLSQSNNSYKPAYYSNVVNTFPVARFNQSMNRLIHNSYSDFPDNEISTIFVNKSNGQSNDGLLSYASSSSDNDYLIFNSNNLTFYRANTNASTSVNISDNTWRITQNTWQNSSNNSILYTNGTLRATKTLNTNSITQNGCLAIGCDQDGINSGYVDNQTHYGDFAEIIIYNFVLPSAQRNIVNNYLSAKYNISVSNDKYAGDNASNGDYDFEVIGIGTESDASHNEAHGSGGLWISQNANFENGDYLLIGHNSDDNRTVDATEDTYLESAGLEQRWKRDWYFDKTDAGNVEAVDLTFDFTEAGMSGGSAPEGNANNYKLIYRSGTSSNWSILGTATTIGSGQVKFENISLSNGDGYYTIGTIDASASPLPIELLKFTAVKNNNNVLLNWTTASEINNDYFEIERSKDLDNWETIGKVQGNGNSNVQIDYKFTDYKPFSGVSYYRLAQFDYDGSINLSNSVSVLFSVNKIVAYPNPINDLLTVKTEYSISKFELLNSNGTLVYSKHIKNHNTYNIDMNNFSKGIYFLRVYSDDKINVLKLVKE